MADAKWLDGYSGQTVEQLIALEGEYRVDSLVLAFEQALQQKTAGAGTQGLSAEERTILAVEALEREVNNGGFGQFFANSSREFVPLIVASLQQIGCTQTAEITQKAVLALHLSGSNAEAIGTAMAEDNEERDAELDQCDELYDEAAEDIAGLLFAFIKAHKGAIKIQVKSK
jgi:hypothetical protein